MQPSEFVPQPGTLYVVATPIGNLRDITLRALDVLRSVDVVAAEDTRVTQGLLAAYGIRKPLTALHEHNEVSVTPRLVEALKAGRSVALVSDAGTPGLSDPGAYLVRSVRASGLPLVPIPGASAVTATLSVAGLAAPRWLFHGFLPAKAQARRQTLAELAALPFHLVFYEAPHRIMESVADMAAVLGPERELVLARELTKRFEQVTSLTLGQALDWLAADPDRQRGEFVLIVSGAVRSESPDAAAARKLVATLLKELPASQAARIAARLTGVKRSDLYAWALAGKSADQDSGPAS
ncbi:MAG: 16S rRNA (cytidine(1402)-2'-O)-methyltransferase [Thiobacillaceae bacterium]